MRKSKQTFRKRIKGGLVINPTSSSRKRKGDTAVLTCQRQSQEPVCRNPTQASARWRRQREVPETK